MIEYKTGAIRWAQQSWAIAQNRRLVINHVTKGAYATGNIWNKLLNEITELAFVRMVPAFDIERIITDAFEK